MDLTTVVGLFLALGLIRVQMFFRRRITLPLRRLGEPLACS